MEPTEGAVVTYIIHTILRNCEEKFQDTLISAHGEKAEFKRVSLGWFILLDGSLEAIKLGELKPECLAAGDRVRITITKEPHALPLNPPLV